MGGAALLRDLTTDMFKMMSDKLRINMEGLIPQELLLAIVIGLGVVFLISKTLTRPSSPPAKPATQQYSAASYYDITPLPTLNITTEEPLKARPFKPKYHLTMALESTSPSDLLTMDKTYLPRLALRTHLLATQRAEILACTAPAEPAVLELYTYLTRTYLPQRFPTIFTLRRTGLWNIATATLLPLCPASADAALDILGRNVDAEFSFLLPSGDAGAQKYRLGAFIFAFPSGFRTRAKLGLDLAGIHGPVPGYAAKLERSMDRFFAGLGVGRVVRRWNWTVSSAPLFCLSGNHASKEEMEKVGEEGGGTGMGEEEVDLNAMHLRCERQTLHRLPESGAIVFAFKTYTYPLSEIRDEGNGEEMAAAIDGLAEGSVPLMAVYKKQVVWGKKVKAYLRGEIDA